MSSILNDVKHSLGIPPADTAFDVTLIQHINSALMTLSHLGVGDQVAGFQIADSAAQWTDFYDTPRLNTIKSYMYLRTRLLFDPPQTGFTQQAFERQISEMEFRVLAEVDF